MNTKAATPTPTPAPRADAWGMEHRSSLHGAFFAIITAFAAELCLEYLASPVPYEFSYFGAFGRILIIFFSVLTLHRFACISFRSYQPDLKNIFSLMLILVGTLLIVWVGRFISVSLSAYLKNLSNAIVVEPDVFYFAIPFGAGALLLQAILGLQYGLVFALTLALMIGIYIPSAPLFVPYVLTTSMVACLSLSRFRSRSAYLRAGFNVSLSGFIFAFSWACVTDQLLSSGGIIAMIGALVGGVLCAFLASGVTPIVEHLGGYVTDIRLIEMATLDHPLLKDLSVQAPGTWNHSMVMGMMVESAADAIGANSVLSRVGAYFHDIGKAKKPLYFVENQGGEENRHDKLSSSMSALIIKSHVKDGIELSRKHGLPKLIEDMIPQHHGTSRIEYFYDKACKESQEANTETTISVDESLYRYPGPKPQTKEAGILMLADGIEAAARTLGEPTFDRIQGMVQKMINKVFASGELNECDLTLKDLHHIAKAFTRVLSGIYHQRIAYAEPAEKTRPVEASSEEADGESVPTEEKELGAAAPAKKPKISTEEKAPKDTPKEDLKRLGL